MKDILDELRLELEQYKDAHSRMNRRASDYYWYKGIIQGYEASIKKIEKFLTDKRNVQRGEEKSFKACKECPHPITKCSKIGHCDYE